MKVEQELNGSVFSWSLVNIILSLLSPGFILLVCFLAKNPLAAHSIFLKKLITGSNMLYICGLLEIFLLAQLTLE